LLFIGSKIQFSESKSQLPFVIIMSLFSCLSVQRYNFLKANHNSLSYCKTRYVLFIGSKIQFSESKSQQVRIFLPLEVCCLSVQRYNFLKANHNNSFQYSADGVLFIGSKIQFSESKSQPFFRHWIHVVCCLSVQRYNFLKANHNKWV